MQPTQIRLTIPDSCDPTSLMGTADSHLRQIEASFQSSITVRGNQITIIGEAGEVDCICSVFSKLIEMVEVGVTPTESDVSMILNNVSLGVDVGKNVDMQAVLTTFKGRAIRPKSDGQASYIKAIKDNTITFCAGPAGTGKTYLAMAMAVAALRRRDVSRIILARPVVEAGESLGFLPGTLEEKLDPYVRPLYDALFEMCDLDVTHTMIEDGVIEIAPLAFMRGRTFNDAFVILDEAQNTTPSQMKMFLTRLGYNSKFVITGDTSQCDTFGEDGLHSAKRILDGVEDIAFVELEKSDIARHTLVAKIVDAYTNKEENNG